MKTVVAAAVASTVLFTLVAGSAETGGVHGIGSQAPSYGAADVGSGLAGSGSAMPSHLAMGGESPPALSSEALTEVVRRVCAVCHNDRLLTGNLSLQGFDVAAAARAPETTEKVIKKLRAGMMPPPGMPRPAGDTLVTLVETLERMIDQAAAARPNSGDRPAQRLNRAEYEASIRELLGLQISAGDYLPLDTKSENFDNIADVQMLSPTLLEAYLNAAAEITRLAIGNRDATPVEKTYSVSGYASQLDRVEGAPFGTRGGLSVIHNFPADGEYVFRFVPAHTTTGEGFFGKIARFERIELSIEGERVALVDIDPWMTVMDPEGISMRTDPIHVRAGPQRVTAAFVKIGEGPVPDLMSPHEWSMADRHTGMSSYGLTALPHLQDLVIGGPFTVTGVSDTPVRRRIFTCRPVTVQEEAPCATEILTRLAAGAYRRPVTPRDLDGLMKFYEMGAAEGGFEKGIQISLQAILASPHFVFRLEGASGRVRAGENYRISDLALASRLSFFLWGTPPDEELSALAARGRLSSPAVLEAQARRMLADPRSEALATRFASQWLRLQDLEKVNPDTYWFPDYDQQLADAMRRETETFFHHLVREDRSLLELYTADYTFLNERLARHYDIPGVRGGEFRRVSYPDAGRRGILGHGSVLVSTSLANRTSPVLRGKWVMEVLLGTPPPPPPPGVPDLEETQGAMEGRMLTTRERMEVHRASPVCRSCHLFMDPIGLALDNFDVTGKWRIRENGMPLDTRGQLYEGTPISNPNELLNALMVRPTPLIRTFTENLMAYAVGRRVEWYDKAAVRAIARDAAKNDHRMSAFILGVIRSDAFQMKNASDLAAAGQQ